MRTGLPEVARAALVSGFIGGIGFASASMLKLVEVMSGYETNWHSILEQTTGLFNGIGIAVAIRGLAVRAPRLDGEGDSTVMTRRWAEPVAVGFVLLGIPYLNLRKNVRDWVRVHAVPEVMYGIPAWFWFDLAFLVVAMGMIVLLARNGRRRLNIIPADPMGQGQGLYLLLLAIMVIGNFERAVVSFEPQRLVTEGVIHVGSVLCAVVLLTSVPPHAATRIPASNCGEDSPIGWGRLMVAGFAAAVTVVVIDWAIIRGLYGDRFAGHSGLHIRFGPGATTHSSKGSVPPSSG
jgi:hypothetical protein